MKNTEIKVNLKTINEYLKAEISKKTSISRADVDKKFIINHGSEVVVLKYVRSLQNMLDEVKELGFEDFINEYRVDQIDVVEEDDVQDEEVEKVDIIEQFKNIEDFMDMVLNKQKDAIVIAGPGGIGKSEIIFKKLQEAKKEFKLIKSYAAPFAFYNLVKENKDGIITIDDCDSVFRDEKCLNIIKACLDTSKKRLVQWNSTGNEVEEFEFTGTMIVASNLDFFKIKAKAAHVSAVMTRCLYVQITDDRDEILKWIDQESRKVNGFNIEIHDVVFDFLKNKTNARVQFRLYNDLVKIYKLKPARFESLAREICRATHLE